MRRTLIRNMTTGEWRKPGSLRYKGVTPTETEWRKIYLLDLTPRGTHLPCGSYHEEWDQNHFTGQPEEWYTLYT